MNAKRHTEEDNDVIVLVKDILQHLRIDLFDLARYLQGVLVRDPRQYLVLVVEVTGVNQRFLVPEECERREMLDTVFLRYADILGGDEYNTGFIQLVVDVLQLVEDIVAFLTLVATPT